MIVSPPCELLRLAVRKAIPSDLNAYTSICLVTSASMRIYRDQINQIYVHFK